MLCATRISDQEIVLASSQERNGAPFACPQCSQEVTLRKGSFKIHHFAHKPPVTCAYGLGETDEHRRCKAEIYEALIRSPNVKKPALERPLKDVRTDVSAYINGIPVAIEVQISTLPLATVIHRTKEYAKRGIALLWLAQWNSRLAEERYSPRPWELWVHAAYFGRIYYWKERTVILPVHFAKHYMHVKQTDWRDEDGEEQSGGGYDRASKRYRTPQKGTVIDLRRDFSKRPRDEFAGGSIYVPEALLYCKRQPERLLTLNGTRTAGVILDML